MSRSSLLLAVLAVAITAATPTQAASLVSLSSPDDLSNLAVGDEVRIDVTLSGLDSGFFIFNLFTRVIFPSSNLELVSGPTPSKAFGSVFFGPDPIADPQLANFDSNSGPIPGGGGVIGNSPDETANGVGGIGQNGLYYAFVVRATAAGSGTIGFDLSTPDANRYSGTETNNDFAPLPTGPNLAFSIVPEPSSVVMGATALVLVATLSRKRRPR